MAKAKTETVESLSEQLAEAMATIKEQKRTISAHEKTIKTQDKTIQKREEELQEQATLIDELNETNGKLASQTASGKGRPMVTIDKVDYEIRFPKIIHDKKEIAAHDLAANKDLCRELIKKGSKALVKL